MFAKGLKREKGGKKVLRIGKLHITPAWTQLAKNMGLAKTREPLGLHLKPKVKWGAPGGRMRGIVMRGFPMLRTLRLVLEQPDLVLI